MQHHDDFAFEPIPGLPARLPAGEEILWQGRPATLALARESMGLTWIAGYFCLLAIWRAGASFADHAWQTAGLVALTYVLLGAAVCLIILAIAWAQARGALYTITTARVVMRIGAALQITLNLPFSQIENARLDLRRSGTGTIALEPKGDVRISYLVCWPHVRPWHARKTEPALRCIPDARAVAGILADAAMTRITIPQVRHEPIHTAAPIAAAE